MAVAVNYTGNLIDTAKPDNIMQLLQPALVQDVSTVPSVTDWTPPALAPFRPPGRLLRSFDAHTPRFTRRRSTDETDGAGSGAGAGAGAGTGGGADSSSNGAVGGAKEESDSGKADVGAAKGNHFHLYSWQCVGDAALQTYHRRFETLAMWHIDGTCRSLGYAGMWLYDAPTTPHRAACAAVRCGAAVQVRLQ